MGIMDSLLVLANKKAITATGRSDVIDFGHSQLIAPGAPLWLNLLANVGLGGTSPTVTFALQSDDNEAFGSAKTLLTYPQLAAAAFATGALIVIPFPWDNERFFSVNATLGGTSPTLTYSAWLSPYDPSHIASFPDGL